jgi:hypothetical protein
MKNALLAATVATGGALVAPSAFAYTAQALCPQWVQRGPIIEAICFNGHNNDLQPASIDIRSCAPGADINNFYGQLVCINPQRPARRGPPQPGYGGGYGPPGGGYGHPGGGHRGGWGQGGQGGGWGQGGGGWDD